MCIVTNIVFPNYKFSEIVAEVGDKTYERKIAIFKTHIFLFLNGCFPSPVTAAGEFQGKTFPKVEVHENFGCAIGKIKTQIMFVFVDVSLELNRSRGQCFLQEVNTITTAASCCCAGAQEAQSVGEVGAARRMREADRTGQCTDDNDKLPCIYSNCVT